MEVESSDGTTKGDLGEVAYGYGRGKLGGQASVGDWSRGGQNVGINRSQGLRILEHQIDHVFGCF